MGWRCCRIALQVVQRNLRKYLQLRTWPWWKLWQKVKPMLNVTRIEDEMKVRADLFLATNNIIIFRSLTKFSSLPSLPPHPQLRWGPAKYEVDPSPTPSPRV